MKITREFFKPGQSPKSRHKLHLYCFLSSDHLCDHLCKGMMLQLKKKSVEGNVKGSVLKEARKNWHSLNQVHHIPPPFAPPIRGISHWDLLPCSSHLIKLASPPTKHIRAGSNTHAVKHRAGPAAGKLLWAGWTPHPLWWNEIKTYPRRPFPAQRFGVSPRCTFLPLRMTVTLSGLWEGGKNGKKEREFATSHHQVKPFLCSSAEAPEEHYKDFSSSHSHHFN